MYDLSDVEIEEVSGGDLLGSGLACVSVGGAAARVGAYFGPEAGAAAALGGCVVGIALYNWQ